MTPSGEDVSATAASQDKSVDPVAAAAGQKVADEICKINEDIRVEAKKMDYIFRQLIDYCSALFFQEENAPIDDAESARLVGEIEELDRLRREIDIRIDSMMQECYLLIFEHKPKKLVDPVFCRLVDQVDILDTEQREAAKRMDHLMERVTAHCAVHFTDLFDLSFEE